MRGYVTKGTAHLMNFLNVNLVGIHARILKER